VLSAFNDHARPPRWSITCSVQRWRRQRAIRVLKEPYWSLETAARGHGSRRAGRWTYRRQPSGRPRRGSRSLHRPKNNHRRRRRRSANSRSPSRDKSMRAPRQPGRGQRAKHAPPTKWWFSPIAAATRGLSRQLVRRCDTATEAASSVRMLVAMAARVRDAYPTTRLKVMLELGRGERGVVRLLARARAASDR